MESLNLSQEPISYKGWIIEPADSWPASLGFKYQYYRQADERMYHAYTLEEAKDDICERIMTSLPEHKVVVNGREYFFAWIEDAIKFAVKWNAEEFIPGVTA
jgi:hypothetical protein